MAQVLELDALRATQTTPLRPAWMPYRRFTALMSLIQQV